MGVAWGGVPQPRPKRGVPQVKEEFHKCHYEGFRQCHYKGLRKWAWLGEEFRNFDPKEGVQQVRRSSTTGDAQLQILKEKNVETCYIRKKTEMRNFKYGRTCFNNKLVSRRAKKDINFGHFYQ